ncbi:MAG: LysM peptidoglycan-binding domain-containing protein [Pseudobacteriovorax sp.]|nr:LysM peptidoglycan-binding domain-containing protein [Pseudobacteriovorax sp.]
MRLYRAFFLSLFLGLPFLLNSCSSDGDQEQIQEEVFQQEDDEEDFENQEDNFDQEEDSQGNNFNNTGFNSNVNNQFFNNEGNQAANIQGDQGIPGEDNIQQVVEELNAGNVDQFGDQGNDLANNPLLANDAGDQGLVDQSGGFEEQVPQEVPTGSTVGTPLAPGLPEMGSKMSYMVQKGDTLAKIATKVYGEPSKWTEIAEFTGIANPRLIYPGDVVYYQLTEQTSAFASAYESTARSEITVAEGDTLSTIAGRVLGNSANWKLIWRLNDNIANPDRLVAGSVIYYIAPEQFAEKESETVQEYADHVHDEEQEITSLAELNAEHNEDAIEIFSMI